MLKLYAIVGTCSLGPHILLELGGEPFEIKLLDRSRGEQKSPEYLAINPHGKVPALQVGEAIILENVAIQFYLAERFKHLSLAPTDVIDRANWLTFLTWCSNAVHPSFRRFRRPELYVDDQAAQANLSQNARTEFIDSLGEMDLRLKDRRWLLGDKFTTADAYAHIFHMWARMARFPIENLTELRRHGRAMMEMPAVQRALDREGVAVQM